MRFLCPAGDAEREHRQATLAAAAMNPVARAAVDSGKLAEPFWYTDSPLTTGTPPADFPCGPGQLRPPVAGVLCPDGPVRVPEAAVGRLRELFGSGFVLLAGDGVDDAALDVGDRGGAPLRAYRLRDLDHDGVVGAALGATAGWLAVVRPDGHLAAVLDHPDPAAVRAAIDRARGV
jgi:hypothetical protein